MYKWEFIELFATFFNISSNTLMFICMIRDSDKKVPKIVIYFQICGNISWIISSVMRNDPYLGTTSFFSLAMQCATATVLNRKKEIFNKLTSSTDELPNF